MAPTWRSLQVGEHMAGRIGTGHQQASLCAHPATHLADVSRLPRPSTDRAMSLSCVLSMARRDVCRHSACGCEGGEGQQGVGVA